MNHGLIYCFHLTLEQHRAVVLTNTDGIFNPFWVCVLKK